MNDYVHGMKLMLSYNMQTNAMQDYYQFVLGRYIPLMRTLGLDMSEAWGTLYGNGPDRLICFICRDEDTMHSLVANETWHELNTQLLQFVTDFEYKVVPFREGFQI